MANTSKNKNFSELDMISLQSPNVVPSLRQWTAGADFFHLNAGSRIVIESPHTSELIDTATTFQVDLNAIIGRSLPIVIAPGPASGDLFLSLNTTDTQIGNQGYIMEVTEYVDLRAHTSSGIFYGTRTVLQILKQDAAKSDIPQGKAIDYSQYGQRGVMLDAGRKYWSMAYLENLIKEMAWQKMNFLHMHFTEADAFRLQSDLYPGLAASQSYSKADIRQMQDIAKRYHVTLVPEIDVPGHANSITNYNPALKFDSECTTINMDPWGGHVGGWTIDISKDANRQWVKSLFDEFIPLFDSPYFHIGGDEYPYDEAKNACPDLVNYAKEKGFAYTNDVFIDFFNELNCLIKSYGKKAIMWNGWESYDQQRSIQPDRDIIMNAWDHSSDWFLSQGYMVESAEEDPLYVSFNLPTDERARKIYESWNPSASSSLLGYKICVWGDGASTQSDLFFEGKMKGMRAALAERTWGGPRSTSAADFFARVDRVGNAPCAS